MARKEDKNRFLETLQAAEASTIPGAFWNIGWFWSRLASNSEELSKGIRSLEDAFVAGRDNALAELCGVYMMDGEFAFGRTLPSRDFNEFKMRPERLGRGVSFCESSARKLNSAGFGYFYMALLRKTGDAKHLDVPRNLRLAADELWSFRNAAYEERSKQDREERYRNEMDGLCQLYLGIVPPELAKVADELAAEMNDPVTRQRSLKDMSYICEKALSTTSGELKYDLLLAYSGILPDRNFANPLAFNSLFSALESDLAISDSRNARVAAQILGTFCQVLLVDGVAGYIADQSATTFIRKLTNHVSQLSNSSELRALRAYSCSRQTLNAHPETAFARYLFLDRLTNIAGTKSNEQEIAPLLNVVAGHLTARLAETSPEERLSLESARWLGASLPRSGSDLTTTWRRSNGAMQS